MYAIRRYYRSEDTPIFTEWDGEVAAVEGDYNARDPRSVASDYETAAHRAAELFAPLDEDAWQRPRRHAKHRSRAHSSRIAVTVGQVRGRCRLDSLLTSC